MAKDQGFVGHLVDEELYIVSSYCLDPEHSAQEQKSVLEFLGESNTYLYTMDSDSSLFFRTPSVVMVESKNRKSKFGGIHFHRWNIRGLWTLWAVDAENKPVPFRTTEISDWIVLWMSEYQQRWCRTYCSNPEAAHVQAELQRMEDLDSLPEGGSPISLAELIASFQKGKK